MFRAPLCVPNRSGRQAVTFHNQRDFIFFRRHRYVPRTLLVPWFGARTALTGFLRTAAQCCRYIFKDGKRANLQELGPQFCLKLQWLQKGTFDVKFGDYEWQHKVRRTRTPPVVPSNRPPRMMLSAWVRVLVGFAARARHEPPPVLLVMMDRYKTEKCTGEKVRVTV